MPDDLDSLLPDDIRKQLRMTKKLMAGTNPPKAILNKRKQPRLSIDTINQMGGDEFKRRAGEALKTRDERPAYVRVLDVLDLPRNVVGNVIGSIAGVDKSKLERGTFGLPKVYMSDVLDKLGVKSQIARSVAGLVGDVAIDPLTYLTLGASAGTKVAQFLPRIVKGGTKLMSAAARTGDVAPKLAKALGMKAGREAVTMARLKSFTALRLGKDAGKEVAKEAVEKTLWRKGGGKLGQFLAARTARGEKGALEFVAQYGEKGRGLFRAPGMERAIGTLPFGARASKYKAVTEGLNNPQTWTDFLKARGATIGEAGKATAKGIADVSAAKNLADQTAKYQTAAQAAKRAKANVGGLRSSGVLGQLSSKFEVTPEARTVLERVVGSGKLTQTTNPDVARQAAKNLERVRQARGSLLKAAQTGAKEAASASAEAQTALQAARGELTRLATGPKAPGVIKEMVKATMKPAPEFIQKNQFLRQLWDAKNKLFGPGRSPLWQEMLAVRNVYGPASFARGGQEITEAATKLQPIINKLVQEGKGTPDDITRMVHEIATAGGPSLKGLEAFAPAAGKYPADAIYSQIPKWKQAGLLDNPEVASFIDDFFATGEVQRAAQKLRGMPGSEIPNYVPSMMVPEGKARIQEVIQRAGGAQRQGKQVAGAKFGLVQPSDLARTRNVEYTLPNGEIQRVLDTGTPSAQAALAELKAQAASMGGKLKKTGEYQLSPTQWNELEKGGKLQKLLGAPLEGQEYKPLKKGLFETDLAKAAGARRMQHEKALASADLRDMMKRYAVPLSPEQLAGDSKYTHLSHPMKPPGNVLPELQAEGLFQNAYPKPVSDMIDHMTAVVQHEPSISQLLQATDKALGLWKTMALYHPAYVIRNAWQNAFGILMAGGNPVKAIQIAFDKKTGALRNALVDGSPKAVAGMTIKIGGVEVPMEQIYEVARRRGLYGVGRTAQEMPRQALGGLGGSQAVKELAGRAGGRGKQALGVVHKFNSALEDRMRLGAWLQFADRGMDLDSAAVRTLVAMPDLSDMTKFEGSVAKRIIPFYSWMKKNGSLQVFHYLTRKPMYAAMLPRLKNLAEGVQGMDNVVPEAYRPEWMREGSAIQVAGDKEKGTAFLPQSWFPFQEVYDAMNLAMQPGESARSLISRANPAIKTGLQAGLGQDIFKMTPYEEGTKISLVDLVKAFPQAILGKSGTPLDSLVSVRPVREIWRAAEMGNPGAAAGRMLIGGALQPLNAKAGAYEKYKALTTESQKLRTQIANALKSNDKTLAGQLSKQYVAIMRRLHELGLPGVAKATKSKLEQSGIPAGKSMFGEQ